MSNLGGIFTNAIKKDVGFGSGTSGSFTNVYTAPTLKTSYVMELDIACTSDSGVQVSVQVVDASSSPATAAYLVKNAPVPQGSSLRVIDGQKIVLKPGDSIQVKCETETESVDVIASLVEDVN